MPSRKGLNVSIKASAEQQGYATSSESAALLFKLLRRGKGSLLVAESAI